jgi:hypothetical protein
MRDYFDLIFRKSTLHERIEKDRSDCIDSFWSAHADGNRLTSNKIKRTKYPQAGYGGTDLLVELAYHKRIKWPMIILWWIIIGKHDENHSYDFFWMIVKLIKAYKQRKHLAEREVIWKEISRTYVPFEFDQDGEIVRLPYFRDGRPTQF